MQVRRGFGEPEARAWKIWIMVEIALLMALTVALGAAAVGAISDPEER